MATRTVSNLIGSIKVQAGLSGASTPVDSEVVDMINSSYNELYGLMVTTYGDQYFLSSSNITTSANVDTYALPDNFKVVGLDLLDAATSITFTKLDRFNFQERDKFSRSTTAPYFNSIYFGNRGKAFEYDIEGENLKLIPTPGNVAYLRLWTVPNLTYFSGTTTESANFKNGWDEYIVVDCAMKIKDSYDWDSSVLQGRKMALLQRLRAEIPNRNSGDPMQIMSKRNRWGKGLY